MKFDNECYLCGNQTEYFLQKEFICSKCLNKERKRVRNQNSRARKKGQRFLKITIEDWLSSLKDCNFCCPKCDSRFTRQNLTLDHVISMSAFGPNSKNNIQPMCAKCHETKALIETKLKGNKKKRREAEEYLACFQSDLVLI